MERIRLKLNKTNKQGEKNCPNIISLNKSI